MVTECPTESIDIRDEVELLDILVVARRIQNKNNMNLPLTVNGNTLLMLQDLFKMERRATFSSKNFPETTGIVGECFACRIVDGEVIPMERLYTMRNLNEMQAQFLIDDLNDERLNRENLAIVIGLSSLASTDRWSREEVLETLENLLGEDDYPVYERVVKNHLWKEENGN